MSSTAISTATMTGAMLSPIGQVRTALAQAQTELASGRHSDIGLLLGGRTADAAALHAARTRLDAFTNSNAAASTRLTATADALSSVLNSVQTLQKSVLAGLAGNAPSATLTTQSQAASSSILATLNTTVAGQHVFAGINTDVQPFADGGTAGRAALLGAFTATFGMAPTDPAAATISPAAMKSFLEGPAAQSFDAPAWANWSGASDQAITTRLSPTQVAATSVSANDGALRGAVQATAILSVLDGAALSKDTRAALLDRASTLLGDATRDIATLGSTVGTMQTTASDAGAGITRASRFVDTQIGALEDADPAELSTRIASLMTQLESAYTLTGRISQLSLVHFLP